MSRKTLIILFIITVAAIAATVLIRTPRQDSGPMAQGPYFPALLARSNDVRKAIVKDPESTTTISNDDGQWVIEEKGNYPASIDKVRELVLGLARLQRLEGKTGNPDHYARLELGDVSDPDSTSKLVQLVNGSGSDMAVLIVGKEKRTQSGSFRRQFYVRSPGDPQAWLVEGLLPDLNGAIAWMDTSLLGPDWGDIRSVTISTGADSWTVARDSTEKEAYTLEDLTPNEEVESQYIINNIVRSFTDLTFDDVRPVPAAGEKTDRTEVVAQTFDGVRVGLTLNKQGDQFYGRLTAGYHPTGEPNESIEDAVSKHNDLWRVWEYVLPGYQVENIIAPRESLIKKEVEAPVEQ